MNRKLIRIGSAVGALAVVAGAGAAGGAAVYATAAHEPTTTVVREVPAETATPAADRSELSIARLYEQARKAVVEITVTTESSSSSSGLPFGQEQEPSGQAQGSGFVIDREGHIVTNDHVVDNASSISVLFSNGKSYDASLVGSDPSTDLAVIDVDAPASLLEPLSLGDSDELAVGDGVVAIGSPFGLEGTLTAGIVSALHRQMTAPNDFAINDSIQTDAAINHGNSGGPLLDLQGRVVGVNAQIKSESGGNVGIGFAIPSNTVESIVSQLVQTGKVEHAYLGIGLQEVSAGVEVTEVREGSPAAQAGLRSGDVITAVAGESVRTAENVQKAVDAKRPGDSISITYERDGTRESVHVELATRPV